MTVDPRQVQLMFDVLFPAVYNAVIGIPAVGPALGHTLSAVKVIVDSPDVFDVIVKELNAIVANHPSAPNLSGLATPNVIPGTGLK